MTTKYPWESKTIVLNFIMALLAGSAFIFPAASGISAFIASHGPLIGTIWGVLNIALRFITKDAIQLGD